MITKHIIILNNATQFVVPENNHIAPLKIKNSQGIILSLIIDFIIHLIVSTTPLPTFVDWVGIFWGASLWGGGVTFWNDIQDTFQNHHASWFQVIPFRIFPHLNTLRKLLAQAMNERSLIEATVSIPLAFR